MFESPDLSGGFVRKRWWSKCLQVVGSSRLLEALSLSAPAYLLKGLERTTKETKLNTMFAKFIREILQTWFLLQAEMGTWVLSKPTAPYGDQTGQQRVIGASWPQLSPIASTCISARGWERPETLWYWSCSPLIIIPADLHQVLLTHQPHPNDSAIDRPYSFVPSSKPSCWNRIWCWVTRA